MSGFVGLDPMAASGLATHLEEAAVDLEAHADRVARLLVQADITSSNAPAEIRDVAAWARYRSRDLRRRIDKIVAAAGGRNALDVPGFRFANGNDARKAGRDEANKVWDLIRSHNRKRLDAELDALTQYGNDPAYVGGFFKGLGPTRSYALLTATAGRDSAVIVGRALVLARKTGGITAHFIDGIVEAARKAAEAIQAYTGALSDEDRARFAQDEYVRRAGSQHPTLTKYLEAIAPLTPYLEAGARVAVIGGAVVVLTTGAVGLVGEDAVGVGTTVEVLAGTGTLDAVALEELEGRFGAVSADFVDADGALGGVVAEAIPQGISEEKFANASQLLREGAGELSADIRVQGSRAAFAAQPGSDIDFAVRVSRDRFAELIRQFFGTPNPGSAWERTMLRAIETGKIQAGEAGLSGMRRSLEQLLEIDVDVSVIEEGGMFDQGPWIPIQ